MILNNFNQTFFRSLESELRQLMCAVVQSLQTSGIVDLKTWHSFSSYMVKSSAEFQFNARVFLRHFYCVFHRFLMVLNYLYQVISSMHFYH